MNTSGQASQSMRATKGTAQDANSVKAAKATIMSRRPCAGSRQRSASMPAGSIMSALPSPLAETSSAAAAAPRPRARPYSGRMEVTPLSKNPPVKPASMMMGCACSACQTPCRPTRALAPSCVSGSLGTSQVLAQPANRNATAIHSAAGLAVPTQASRAGPMMKVTPIIDSNRPTLRPRLRGSENSATKDSASTQRNPPAMPESSTSRYHSGIELVNANPRPANTGSTAASQSAGRRPNLRVTAEAKGVIKNTPSQLEAANKPAMAVVRPASLRRSSIKGLSMKMPTSSRKVETKIAPRPSAA